MLFHAAAYYRPVARKAFTGRTGLHNRQRSQRLADFSRKTVGVQILPDSGCPRGICGRLQFHQTRGLRGNAPVHLHQARWRIHGRQCRATFKVAGHPTALHQHGLRLARR